MSFRIFSRIIVAAMVQIFFLGNVLAQEKACRVEHTALYGEDDWYSKVKKVAPQALVDEQTPVLIVCKQSSVSVTFTEILFVTPLLKPGHDPFAEDTKILGYQLLVFNDKHRKSPWKKILKGPEVDKIESLWELSSDLTRKAEYGVMSKEVEALFKKGALFSCPEYYIMATHRKSEQFFLAGGYMTGRVVLPDANTPSDQFEKAVKELFALAIKE